ncbi:MAG: methyltransferase domain-containing protein [Bacteroidota bacterium]
MLFLDMGVENWLYFSIIKVNTFDQLQFDMNLKDLQKNWDKFGREDPYWAIITEADKKGNKWTDEEFFLTGQHQADRIVKQFKRTCRNQALSKAVDFGCGAGRVTQGLANHFEEVHGVDIAPSMIKLAKEKSQKANCHFHLNEQNDLQLFEDQQFDLVFSIITLQHMQPKYAKNYIREFFRILKPGGMMMFQIPSKPDRGTQLYHKVPSPLKGIKSMLGSKKEEAIMEMYWINISEMTEFLQSLGGQIHRILRDDSAGEGWDSFTYSVGLRPSEE